MTAIAIIYIFFFFTTRYFIYQHMICISSRSQPSPKPKIFIQRDVFLINAKGGGKLRWKQSWNKRPKLAKILKFQESTWHLKYMPGSCVSFVLGVEASKRRPKFQSKQGSFGLQMYLQFKRKSPRLTPWQPNKASFCHRADFSDFHQGQMITLHAIKDSATFRWIFEIPSLKFSSFHLKEMLRRQLSNQKGAFLGKDSLIAYQLSQVFFLVTSGSVCEENTSSGRSISSDITGLSSAALHAAAFRSCTKVWGFDELEASQVHPTCSLIFSSWWFQPISKILAKLGIISPGRGENKKYLSCHHLVVFFTLKYWITFNVLFIRPWEQNCGSTAKSWHFFRCHLAAVPGNRVFFGPFPLVATRSIKATSEVIFQRNTTVSLKSTQMF